MNTRVLDMAEGQTVPLHPQNPGEDKCKLCFCLGLFTPRYMANLYCSVEFSSFLFNFFLNQNCKYKFNLQLQQSPQPILQKLYIQSKKKKKKRRGGGGRKN